MDTEWNFSHVKQDIHLRHSTLICLAIIYSWVLWTVVSLPDYSVLSGWELVKEIAIDFFQQIIETTLLLEISLLYIRLIVRLLWKKEKNMKNLIIQVTMLSVLNGISSLASGYVYSIIYPDEDLFGKVVFTDYIDLTILSTTYLVVFLMNRYKKEETTALQTKLKNLSMQTDNHFIFNCFGTLSGLIEEAPQQAILFLDKLSDTYRYLVTNGSSPLVTIKEELNFVDNYTALIKYRYSGIELLYDDTVRNGISGYVCPIALQSLVENAIKHNRHGKNNHLTIIISSDGKYITVTNNIMPRQNDAHSTGNGLAYLKERYSILTKEKVRISSDDRIFSVSLPIINP